MRYTRFEQLPVWQAAIHLARDVYTLTGRHQLRPSLRDQLERAALSVSNNIAEGFERGTTAELLAFLYIARGSAGEVRSILCVMETLPADGGLEAHIAALKPKAEAVSRQLYGWAQSLQNSGVKGQRHLSEESRRKAEQDRGYDDLMARAAEITARARGDA